MSKALEADDLEPGMFVTVLEWHAEERPTFGGDYGMVMTGSMMHRDRSYVGAVLRVVAVDSPFIAVESETFKKPINLDLRRLRLGRVSDEYAKAMWRDVPMQNRF